MIFSQAMLILEVNKFRDFGRFSQNVYKSLGDDFGIKTRLRDFDEKSNGVRFGKKEKSSVLKFGVKFFKR